MRYAIENSGCVELLSAHTPLPEGAIEPIPNWEDVIVIPSCYLKIVDGIVMEKTQQEKDDYDAGHPPTLEELQEEAQTLLDDTDWYVTRYVDPGSGKDIPEEITASRVTAREIL